MSSYNYSYNVLINRLEAFAAGHFLIKRFTHGQIDLADQLQDDEYPFMHVVPEKISPVDGGMQFDFLIMFADIPRDKEYKAEYQREVISDCVRLGQDLIAEVKNGLQLFGFDVQLVNNPTFEPFMEEQKNTVTGVTFTLSLEVPWDWSACDIPAIWSVGGSSTGGSGTGYGITLQTNGVNNVVQNLLNLEAGTNITITDNGNGTVTIDSTGGGGGGSPYVSTEYNANHTTAQGNPYQIGDRVWYNGSVYACIANNDGINPSNPAYWTLQSAGYRLRQTPVDWNASSGDYQILNKPTLATVATTGDYNDLINTPAPPTPQGLQDVITTDNDLTLNNTIEGNATNLLWNANKEFKIYPDATGFFEVFVGKYPPSETKLKISATEGYLYSKGATTQQFKTDTTNLYIQTPAVSAGTATVGQVLTLGNASTGAVEYTTISAGSGTVTSVGLTMPAAFNVTGSPVTTAGTLAVTGAGTTDQYVRGDGTLANFPATGGGGGQVFYFNGNISQGTIGGNDYYELGIAANTGPAANFTRATTGAIARFITDVGEPNHLIIPAGVWTIDVYLSETGGGANHAQILAKLYTYNGSTFTLVATSTMEEITNGSTPDLYTFTISVPTTTTAATDRIHIEFDIQNTNGKTVTLYTEDARIGEVHSTYAIGLSSLNGLTANTQNFAVGTTGTDFAISSAGSTHTFNLPTASAANRGALSSADYTNFNTAYTNRITSLTTTGTSGVATLIANTLNIPNYGVGTDTFTLRFTIANVAPADNQNYLLADITPNLNTTGTLYKVTFPFACKLVGAGINVINLTGNATTEASTFNFRLNNSTDTLLSNAVVMSGAANTFNVYNITGLSTNIAANDTAQIKWTTPAWATNPAAAYVFVHCYFERT
jgi:hypothetical protein